MMDALWLLSSMIAMTITKTTIGATQTAIMTTTATSPQLTKRRRPSSSVHMAAAGVEISVSSPLPPPQIVPLELPQASAKKCVKNITRLYLYSPFRRPLLSTHLFWLAAAAARWKWRAAGPKAGTGTGTGTKAGKGAK
jgi:hypothetical protein